MDVAKAVSFLVEHAADWSAITISTVTNPVARFELTPVHSAHTARIIGNVQSERELWLNPKLLVFAFVSIGLGLSINALIPNRAPSPDIFASIVIIFVYWLFGGTILHLYCKLLRGKGEYLETLSVIIQVSATIYVVTSFLAFISVAILTLPGMASFVKDIPLVGATLAKEPVFIFFLIGTLLNMIYVPASMKAVHKFGWVRTIAIAILPPVTVWLPVSIFLTYGLLLQGPPPVGVGPPP